MDRDEPVCAVTLLRDPLCTDRDRQVVPCRPGQWLSEVVPACCLDGEWVAVDGGRVLERDEWATHLLVPGTDVVIYPRLRDLVTMVVIGVMVAAMAAQTAFSLTRKPPAYNTPGSNEAASSPTYGFGGIQNATRIGAPIPVVYGSHRAGGQLINAYVETQHDNDVLHMLLALSEGPVLSIGNVEINGQPIRNYAQVKESYRLGLNTQAAIGLFGDKSATTYSTEGQLTTTFITYTTQGTNVNGFVLKVTFPGGLFVLDTDGSLLNASVSIEVDYKLSSAGGWTTGPRETVSLNKRAALRRQIRVDGLAAGQYDIRVRRTTAESGNSSTVDAVHREAVTELVNDGYTYPNVALLAVEAVATNQLSGGLPRVTAVVDGVSVKQWTNLLTYVVGWTNNPAWIVFDMLTNARYGHGRFTWKVTHAGVGLTVTNGSQVFSGSATGWTIATLRRGDVLHDPAGQAIGVVQTIDYGTQTGTFHAPWGGTTAVNVAYEVRSNDLDILSFVQWGAFCAEQVPNGVGGTERRATCNMVFDAEREDVWAAVLRICQVGQASLVKLGNYIRVKIEQAAAPVQLFTMANIKRDSFEEVFLPLKERANIFEVQFLNEANGYQQDMVVLEDPLLYSNSEQPRRKTISSYGITRSSHAARLARFNQRVNRLVTRVISFDVGLDAVACEPGDVIRFQHDLPQWGFGGRVGTGSTTSTIVLDRAVTIEAGRSYEVLFRSQFDIVYTRTVVTGAGTVSTLTVSPAWVNTPARGDVWAFGERLIATKLFRVMTIERTQELEARISASEYSDALYDDAGVAPTNQVQYSALGDLTGPPGQVKNLTMLGQDGAVQNVWVSWSPPGSVNFHHANIYRIDGGRKELLGSSATGSFAISNVPSGTLVTVKVTSVSGLGVESDYVAAPIASLVATDAPPPDVPTLVLEGDRLRWNYPNKPTDLAGFLVRFRPGTSSNWESATPAHDNILLTTDLQIFRRSGVQTYLVKAVDVAGHVSVNPRTVTVDFGLLASENIIDISNHRALGWPGTVNAASIISGDLRADASGVFWTVDTALMWGSNPAALMWTSAYSEMTYEFVVFPTADQVDGTLKLPLTMAGEWSLEYRSDSSRPMWSTYSGASMWRGDSALMWDPPGDFTQWPGQLDHLRQQQYFIRITGHAGVVQAVLQELSVVIDVPDKIETLENVVISAAGTRLVLSGTPRKIVSVRVAIEDDGGSAAYVKVMDKNAALGPLIKVFNSSNVATTGLVDAVVHWY